MHTCRATRLASQEPAGLTRPGDGGSEQFPCTSSPSPEERGQRKGKTRSKRNQALAADEPGASGTEKKASSAAEPAGSVSQEKRPSCQGDVSLEDVLSSLLALAESSPSHSRLGTPSKPPASPVSPDIRHVSFALSPSKGGGGSSLLPEGAALPYGRRCSEGMARPATPISILKHENNRWMGSCSGTEAAAPASLAHQPAWSSTGDVKLTVPLSSGSSSLDRSPDPAAKEGPDSDEWDREQHGTGDLCAAYDGTGDGDSDSEAPPPPGFYVTATPRESYGTDTTTSDKDAMFATVGACPVAVGGGGGDKAEAAAPATGSSPALLRCQWNDCHKPLPKTGVGKIRVHTCPTCYGYFCSRACRNRHRDAKRCALTRISNLCQEVLQKIRHDQVSRQHLSVCAQRGLLSRGRGVIRLVFQGAQRAAQFLERGWCVAGERGQMFYVARDDLQPHDMGARVYSRVRSLCDEYDPERKFVLLVAVCVTQEVVTPAGAGAISREMVVKAVKLRLSGPLPEDDVQTLILPVASPVTAGSNGLLPPQKQRLQGLRHVVRQLEMRGVDLSGGYPELYAKIRAFVDAGELFSPVCMFPTDARTGQVFMCVVLPLADQELLDRMAGTRSAASVKAKKRWMF